MHSLNVARVIVSPCSSHTLGIDMVWDNIRIVSKRYLADPTLASLFADLAIHQSSHLSIGTEFPISPRMMWIVDSLYAKLFKLSPFLDRLPATAGKRAMNWAIFIAPEFHSVLLT
jgi:hypothetical protein